jgi:Ca2+:H+ antiporter
MLPAANLLGFAGQELSRKMPQKSIAVVMETTFGSVVEIILFMVLLKTSVGNSNVLVIQAAILGSILANILLCLGFCFIAGKRPPLTTMDNHTRLTRVQVAWRTTFRNFTKLFQSLVTDCCSLRRVRSLFPVDENISLINTVGLVLPAVFYKSLINNTDFVSTAESVTYNSLKVSRGVAIISLIGYLIYIGYQTISHDGLLHEIYEADEHKDNDRHEELRKPKLTLIEVIVALAISLACVSLIAVSLVEQIEFIVERGVSDAFIGLILIPLVEKIAGMFPPSFPPLTCWSTCWWLVEHLLAIDEAYDNQINMALAHVMGASIQTALLNAPLVVLVGWGIGVDMSYNFSMFDAAALILAVLAVGSFLRDGKSNYLEGVLCVMTYVIIACCAFFFPNPSVHGGGAASGSEGGGH